jgi:hypothetical protein
VGQIKEADFSLELGLAIRVYGITRLGFPEWISEESRLTLGFHGTEKDEPANAMISGLPGQLQGPAAIGSPEGFQCVERGFLHDVSPTCAMDKYVDVVEGYTQVAQCIKIHTFE